MKFGKLTIMDETILNKKLTQNDYGRRINCKCDCGNSVKIHLTNLIRGSIECCGCSSPFGSLPDIETLKQLHQIAEKHLDGHIGLAYYYLYIKKVSEDQMLEEYEPYRIHNQIRDRPTFIYGDYIKHFIYNRREYVKNKHSKLRTWIDFLNCACGQEINNTPYLTNKLKITNCRCDLFHIQALKKLGMSLEIQKRKQLTEHFKPIKPHHQPYQNAPINRNVICSYGNGEQGLCKFYNGDIGNNRLGCLDYWAVNQQTPNWEPGFKCYEPIEVDITKGSRKSISGVQASIPFL